VESEVDLDKLVASVKADIDERRLRARLVRQTILTFKVMKKKAAKAHVTPEGQINLAEFTVLLFQDKNDESQTFLNDFFLRYQHDIEEVKDNEAGLSVPEEELIEYMQSFPSDRLKKLDQEMLVNAQQWNTKLTETKIRRMNSYSYMASMSSRRAH